MSPQRLVEVDPVAAAGAPTIPPMPGTLHATAGEPSFFLLTGSAVRDSEPSLPTIRYVSRGPRLTTAFLADTE